MSFRNLQSLSYAVLFLLVLCCSSIKSCRAQNNQSSCVPSSCGNIGSIRYPFRLRTDAKHCGRPGFELDCRNDQTIITFKSKSFNVEAINYSNYSIRMTDPGLVQESNICSSPDNSLLDGDIPYELENSKPGKIKNDFIPLNNFVVFTNCLNAVNTPSYILLNDTSCSRNSSGGYRYLIVGDYVTSVSSLADSCSVDKVAWVSLTGTPLASGNVSVAGIRRSLAYGFELSWHTVLCDVCDRFNSFCEITNYQVNCVAHCYEDTAYEEKNFGCKVVYLSVFIVLYGGGAIVALVLLRFVIGLCGFCILASRERKRRRLWEMRHKDEQVFSCEVNAEDISK